MVRRLWRGWWREKGRGWKEGGTRFPLETSSKEANFLVSFIFSSFGEKSLQRGTVRGVRCEIISNYFPKFEMPVAQKI